MAAKKLAEGQRTNFVGMRIPSRLDWQLQKAARELVGEGYDTNKSEVIRYILTEYIDNAKAIIRKQKTKKEEPDDIDRD